jgi:hypothetical protein
VSIIETAIPQRIRPRLLQQGIARDLDGETHVDFAIEGLGCRMLVSLSEAEATGGPTNEKPRISPVLPDGPVLAGPMAPGLELMAHGICE